jgi:AcrR family transcriptional regulator
MHTIPGISLKEKQRREREELIIQAAQETLAEKGYYETSMDEIAARVGIAKGTLYTHFASKEELVLAIIKRSMQAFIDGMDTIETTASTPKGRLEALLQLLYSGFFSEQARLISTIYSGVDLKRQLAEKGGCMNDFWRLIATRVTKLLEEGKAAGELNPAIPTKMMLFSFFSLFSPKSYDHLMLGEELPPEEIIRHLSQIYLHGIASPEIK